MGKTKQDYASILRWMSLINTTVLNGLAGWYAPLIGRIPYNKKAVEESIVKTNNAMKVLDDHLLINTYLVSERLTLADVFCAGIIYRAFAFVFDKQWRAEFPSVSRWFETIANQPIYKASVPETVFCDEAMKNVPPPKPKEEKPKAAPKPKAAAKDDDEEPEQEAPKAKHPIEALGRPSVPIDEWKRKYKNEETREVALPWFWQNMPLEEEYSIWKMEFKYNEELTITFMSNNQIGGFFNRLEASRKYIQGCGSVYGVANDSVISGAFVIRGQDWRAAFDVAPDYESYEFTKLDPKKEEDRKFFESMLAWDQPVEVKGKKYEWADGKIFV